MASTELHETARAIVADHKGILAADESTGTIKKRFDSIDVESTEESRRFYRQLLFTASGMEDAIGGVILYDETIRQKADDGTPFPELLASKGSIPGIKVDTGAHDLAGFPGEKVTEGLDGLRPRLEEYASLGARFAKWRAVITIGEGIPTDACLRANAHALARYASLCQEAGIVPIVEPEVLMDADNTLETCWEVTTRTLHETFGALYELGTSEYQLVMDGDSTLSEPARQHLAKYLGKAENAQDSVAALYPLVRLESEAKNSTKASEYADLVVALEPKEAGSYSMKANVLNQAGDAKGAQSYVVIYSALAKGKPVDNWDAHAAAANYPAGSDIASVVKQKGKPEEARTYNDSSSNPDRKSVV